MLAHIQSVANHEGICASVPTVGMASCNDCCELRLEQPAMPSHPRSPCCCIAVKRSSAVPSRISEYDRSTYGVRTRCDGHTRNHSENELVRHARQIGRNEVAAGRTSFAACASGCHRSRAINAIKTREVVFWDRTDLTKRECLGRRQMLLCSSRHESWILLSSSVARWRAKTRRMSLA